MRTWREDIEIADLKNPAQGKWGHPEVQQDAGASAGSGLLFPFKNQREQSQMRSHAERL